MKRTLRLVTVTTIVLGLAVLVFLKLDELGSPPSKKSNPPSQTVSPFGTDTGREVPAAEEPHKYPNAARSRQAERSADLVGDQPGFSGSQEAVQDSSGTLGVQKTVNSPEMTELVEERALDELARRGTLVGALQGIDDKRIWGFAYDRAAPDVFVEVWLYMDGVLVNEGIAASIGASHGEFEPEVPADVQGRAFVFPVPEGLDDGREHTIRALARLGQEDAFQEIQGSPMQIGGNRPPEGRIVALREGMLLGWARDVEKAQQPVVVEVLRDGQRFGTWMADGKPPEDLSGLGPATGWFRITIPIEEEPYIIQVVARDPDQPGLSRECLGSPWTVLAPENELPVGSVAFVTANQVSGWAFDPDVGEAPIEVAVHFDGTFHSRLLADQVFAALVHDPRVDTTNHLWLVDIPPELQDGNTHTISVFAINVPPGANPELHGSPATFTSDRNTEPVGYLDHADTQRIAGWAYDADAGPAPAEVEIWIDGELHEVIRADQTRQDLVPVVSPEPQHGWSLSAPEFLSDGEFHVVRAFVRDQPTGMLRELSRSPRDVNPATPVVSWLGADLAPGEGGRGLEVLAVVEGSPADKSGILVSDHIVGHNGADTLPDVEAFMQWIGSRSVDEQVSLKVEQIEGGNKAELMVYPVLEASPGF